MLVGTIKYKKGSKTYTYNVEGVDTSEVFSLWLTSPSYESITFMSGEESRDDDLWERRFDIQLTKIKVETLVSINDKGKKVKAPVNLDFFCKLGSLLRWVKQNCNTYNEEGYTGLQLASGEFEVHTDKKYIIKFPLDQDRLLAKVVLIYGEISRINIETDTFSIDINEEYIKEPRVFKAIKDAVVSGIRFNEDYLGFGLKSQIINRVISVDGLYHSIEDIIDAHPDKEFRWLLKKDYRIVTDETLEEICNYILNWNGYVYYDTETTGLNINFKSRIGQADQLVGVVLSVKYGESFYFPTQMKYIKNLCDGDHWYFMEHYMKPILEGKELVCHNMEFDWKVSYIYGINANIVHDTMAILKLTLGAEIKDFKVGLKEAAKLLLGRDSLELSDLIIDDSWGQNDIKFWDLPEESVRLYACTDTDNTNGLLAYSEQVDLLGKYNQRKVYEIEVAFSFAVAYQEFYGHRINIDNLDIMREKTVSNQELYLKQMEDIVGHKFNPNSPPQLIKILYTELGIPEQISRKTGKPTTDADTLKKLGELTDAEDNIKYPFVAILLKYRKEEGVRKIIDKFPELMTEDGYLFSKVMQYGTTTGRVSINNPNYQSYNNPVKENVIPRPGYYMFDTDYSSVEYRVLGNMVGNKHIMKSFEDPDFDYHQYQAARMYRVPYASVTSAMRKAAKGINFGLPYGMGDESLGIRVFGEKSEENTRNAAALRKSYFEGQEDIRDWFEFHRDKGVNLGYTETYFDRRRYYRKEDYSVAAIRRQAGNMVIQGCLSGKTCIHDSRLGMIEIRQLAGYKAEIWNGTDWTTGDVLYAGKKRNCIVKFKGGYQIECSPEHKFLVRSHRGNDRFVACKDLIPLHDGDRTRNNAHRVVVCHDLCPSINEYKSNRIYSSYADNANNVYLDMIEDDFKRGVVLGRLSSDGSVSSKTGRVIQIVAEHELDVYYYLIDAMSPLGCSYKIDDVRADRNEALAHVLVCSISLAKEIEELDIRHQIHPKILSNTEMLRGFLCGLFDGDGGVSGKSIIFTQGTQENFEPFMKQIQKALLFFGIRSHYRSYDGDRYVLQIKTNDNERFVETIGFINEQKQLHASELECIEDEHVFGRCLMVEYVEITDEYVDMYDICNTDGGYYIADGVVTHNTAADIYKLAVGRIFKRICKEGWLGKVLLSSFVHDEVLGEVSVDIDPAKFLKILREEFEVKIVNDDGTPWCPLYMGFGYGMSWYEAKSVELPIKLQWELVEKYGDSGFSDWDGDGRKFCDKIPDMLRDFEVRDIRKQILDEDNQGKEIKPALNKQLLQIVKDDSKIYTEALSEYMQDDFNEVNAIGMQVYLENSEQAICEWLDKNYHIQTLYRLEDGTIADRFESTNDTQKALDIFCKIHGVDRSKVNLLNIDDSVSGGLNSSNVTISNGDDEDYEIFKTSEERLIAIRDNRIDTLGMYLDIDNKIIYCLFVEDNSYINFIKSKSNLEGEGYNIYFRDTYGLTNPDKKGAMYSTKAYIKSEDIRIIQDLYLQYFRNKK